MLRRTRLRYQDESGGSLDDIRLLWSVLLWHEVSFDRVMIEVTGESLREC